MKLCYKDAITKIGGFIRNKTENFDGGVIGLSGGIDSTLVAFLSVGVIGKGRVYGLLLPYGNQSTEDGELIAKLLGIKYDIINIKPGVEAIKKQKPEFFNYKEGKGNLQARVRMNYLRGAANKKNMILIGTTNKSEAMIGYTTKGGDDSVDFEPIGDLYKTGVWKLAKYLEILKEKEYIKIPEKIINKTPSADLWKGQTDENELGFDYVVLDNVLQGNKRGVNKKLVERINEMIKNSQHKREMPPICEMKK